MSSLLNLHFSSILLQAAHFEDWSDRSFSCRVLNPPSVHLLTFFVGASLQAEQGQQAKRFGSYPTVCYHYKKPGATFMNTKCHTAANPIRHVKPPTPAFCAKIGRQATSIQSATGSIGLLGVSFQQASGSFCGKFCDGMPSSLSNS